MIAAALLQDWEPFMKTAGRGHSVPSSTCGALGAETVTTKRDVCSGVWKKKVQLSKSPIESKETNKWPKYSRSW